MSYKMQDYISGHIKTIGNSVLTPSQRFIAFYYFIITSYITQITIFKTKYSNIKQSQNALICSLLYKE